MKTWIANIRVWIMAVLVATIGCSSSGGVRTAPSPGVERIPSIVAIHPLLSGTEVDGRYWPIEPLSNMSREEIYLAPPANSELVVTPSSQMLTGELSTQMTEYGFDLRELPYELKDSYGEDGAYVISLALLDELREQHGLGAVMVGNAFFVKDVRRYNPAEIRVVAAYLKVIDTETLEVLCQVTMSYDAHGRELNDLAHSMANQLANMAGLDTN